MFDRAAPYAAFAGRVLLSGIFLMAGLMKLLNWSETATSMANEGMTYVPFFLTLAILFELGGGLSLLLGYKVPVGALALAVFLVPVTLIFHDFWAYQGAQLANQMQHFTKNVTIIGGLLAQAAAGAGAFSLDSVRAQAGARRPGEAAPWGGAFGQRYGI